MNLGVCREFLWKLSGLENDFYFGWEVGFISYCFAFSEAVDFWRDKQQDWNVWVWAVGCFLKEKSRISLFICLPYTPFNEYYKFIIIISITTTKIRHSITSFKYGLTKNQRNQPNYRVLDGFWPKRTQTHWVFSKMRKLIRKGQKQIFF